ncbi:MAG: sterol desaturase family protein [Bdellovibrionales bacterium]|nr:sterol desaturase family protein [Bdellovibrionales bacterium]
MAVRHLKLQQSPLVLSPKPYRRKQIAHEIQTSVASIVVLAANILVIRWLLAFGKIEILEGGTAVQLYAELLVLLMWNEIHFFVAHRLLHTRWLYHFHFVHHREPNISPFAIFRFHPIEAAALGSVIPLVLPFFNFHIESILLFVCASMLLNTLGHSGVDFFGSTRWPELLLASRRHFEHHKYHHVNFGFALPWFDRVLGSSLRNQMSRKAKAGILLFAVASGLSATGRAAPSLIDLNEFVRGQHLEQVLPAGDRVEIVNSIGDAPYGDPAQPVDLKMTCNQSVVVTQGAETKRSQQLSLRLWPSAHNGMRTFISVGHRQTAVSCSFIGDGFDVRLQSEKEKYPVVHELRTGGRECQPLVGRYGCAWSSEVTQPSAMILKNPYLAFASRFEMLMGYRLSESEFVAKDPSMSLDFTRAQSWTLSWLIPYRS